MIYWNKAVRNADTGRPLPLNEPFIGEKPPNVHRCMKQYNPKVYINKTNESFLNQINTSKELYDFLKRIHWSPITLRQVIYKN